MSNAQPAAAKKPLQASSVSLEPPQKPPAVPEGLWEAPEGLREAPEGLWETEVEPRWPDERVAERKAVE